MKKITTLVLSIILLASCSKKEEVQTIVPPTNVGVGTVNYNGSPVALDVKAEPLDTQYNLYGLGRTGNNNLTLSMVFPKKPTAGNYTPEKDKIIVYMDVSNGNVTLRNDLKSTETITVTVNGNRIEASFKDAKFDLRGSTVSYTGSMYVD